LPLEHVVLAQSAIQIGFTVHHATSEYIMLSLWRQSGTESTLPKYNTHLVGAGGIVINQNKELLLVCEKYGRWNVP
jgi:hypothetical protein